MDVAGVKCKAEEELRKNEKKNKPVNTPRATRSNPSPIMAEDQRTATPDPSTLAMILDLKNHISAVNRESTSKWSDLVDQVNGKVEKNTADISEIKKSIERIERSQADLANGVSPAPQSSTRLFTGQQAKYDFARRSLRLWPIRGTDDHEIRRETLRFIREKLHVNSTTFSDAQVERVRRTRQPRRTRGNVNNEALITFTDKYARDEIAAGAKNLSDYKDEAGNPTAGLRMNYPDHLGGDFKALEWYGAEMRRIHGDGTRRSIKFDDEVEGLCIDVKVPAEAEWHRIRPEDAKSFKKRTLGSSAERSRAVLEVAPSRVSRTPLSGANAVPIHAQPVLTPPVLSTSSFLNHHAPPRGQTVETPPMVVHHPDEVIYITPKKRLP